MKTNQQQNTAITQLKFKSITITQTKLAAKSIGSKKQKQKTNQQVQCKVSCYILYQQHHYLLLHSYVQIFTLLPPLEALQCISTLPQPVPRWWSLGNLLQFLECVEACSAQCIPPACRQDYSVWIKQGRIKRYCPVGQVCDFSLNTLFLLVAARVYCYELLIAVIQVKMVSPIPLHNQTQTITHTVHTED